VIRSVASGKNHWWGVGPAVEGVGLHLGGEGTVRQKRGGSQVGRKAARERGAFVGARWGANKKHGPVTKIRGVNSEGWSV